MSAMRQITPPPEAADPGHQASAAGSSVWAATLRAVYIIWYRDVVRYTRDRLRLVVSLAQPLLYLLVFGVGLSSSLGGGIRTGVAGSGTGSVGYVEFMFPGVVGMAILFNAIFAAMSIVWDREFGFLREILVAPINRSAVAVGKALGGATQAMIQGLVMLVFAPVAGVHLDLLTVLKVIPLLFLLAFSLSAFSVALAARLRSMQAFQVVMNFLLMPMFFLSGSLFPLSGLPGWMTALTRIDPVAYGISPVRTVLLAGAGMPPAVLDRVTGISIGGHTVPLLADAGLLLAFGIIMLGLGVWGFRRRD
jgi:ABC-2 type transport system permease protein